MKNIFKAIVAIILLNIYYLDKVIKIGGLQFNGDYFFWSIVLIGLSSIFLIRFVKDREKISKFRQKYFKWFMILIVIMVIELIYRVFRYDFNFQYIRNFRFVLSHLLIILVFTKDMINKKMVDYIMLGMLVLFAGFQFIYLLKFNTIRSSPLLTNVNVYLASLLIIIPYVIFALKRNTLNKYYVILTFIGVLITFFVLPFSGSRAGLFTVSGSLFIPIVLFLKDITKKQIVILITMFSLGIAGCFSMALISKNSMQLNSIGRATSIDFTEHIDCSQVDCTDAGGNKSDDLRGTIWKKSIDNAKSDLILGTGNLLVESYLDGMKIKDQFPHNFVLEYIIVFGIVGSPIYLYLLYSSVIEDIKYKLKNKKKIIDPRIKCVAAQVLLLSVFSFFQPTLSYELIVQILIIGFIGMYYNLIYFDNYED